MKKTAAIYCLFMILGIIYGIILFIIPNFISAQNATDAIAIRVISNDKHYSAARWYQIRGFSGSPQSILVDGYEAVRDGRTVYVNAANINSGVLYTNIYLISYNQDAEQVTEDIFSEVLSHWKFNAPYTTYGACNQTAGKQCLLDSDCPLNEYCLSDKAKIIRDTKRLSDLAEVQILLADYLADKGTYPVLSAGSYLPQKTLSVWPSWQKVLAQELESDLPTDPINMIGNCGDPRFHSETCWDEKKKEFAGAVTATSITLPADSHIFAYTTNNKGTTYTICAIMESGLVSGAASGDCDGTQEIKVTGSKTNQPPQFNNNTLPSAPPYTEYNGFVSASDPDGDPLTWSVDTSGTSWTGWFAAPILKITGIENQRKLYSVNSGNIGSYSLVVTIDDNRGGVVSQTFTIPIGNDPPYISASNASFQASTTKAISYSFTVKDDNMPLAITFSPPILPDNLSGTYTTAGNLLTYTVSGYFTTNPTNLPVNLNKDYNITIFATDAFSQVSTKNITLSWSNNRPTITTPISCPTTLKANQTFPGCTLAISDPDNNAISSVSISGVTGISISTNGIVSGTNPSYGNYSTVITAADEYGGISLPVSYNFQSTSYCGDGMKQNPNYEGLGGPANDGQEECDAPDNVASTAASSNSSKQYSCTSNCVSTGGYCGNSVVNAPYEQCDTSTGGGGTGINDQWECNVCTWDGGYCGDGNPDTPYEDCDGSGGGGTGPSDQWGCTSCNWSGGYCGDGTCNAGYEDCLGCPGDCGVCCVDNCTAGSTQCVSGTSLQNCVPVPPYFCYDWQTVAITNLVNNVHSQADCLAIFGTVEFVGNCNYVCKYPGSTPPIGWSQYQNWSTTSAKIDSGCTNLFCQFCHQSCLSHSMCATEPATCSTSGHSWSNTAAESCSYYDAWSADCYFIGLDWVCDCSAYSAPTSLYADITEIGIY